MSDGDLWRDRNKVFVAGLPANVDDAALYAKFKTFGEMHQSKVVFDNKTGCSKGFGFVTYCEYVHALEAVDNLNQSKWDGRILNVRFLQPKTGAADAPSTTSNGKTTPAPRTAVIRPTKVIGPRPDGCTTLYVGNLAYDITEDVLRKVFEKCGSVKAIRFAEHIQTGEFRGFGYVQFYDEAPCEAATKLDGMIVMGRPMNIDYGSRDEESAKAREDLTKKLKKGVCNKFQTGQCDRGDSCKFAHVLTGEDAEKLVGAADRPVGNGSAGASYMEMAAAALSGEQQTQAPATQTLNPDAPVCINFQKGKCKRGDACKFQHLGVEAAAAAAAVVPTTRPTPVRTPQASDNDAIYVDDRVGAADDATVEAVETPAADDAAATDDDDSPVCQNFQKGKCKRGDGCRFRHVAASAADKKKLLAATTPSAYVAPVRVERPAAVVADVALCQNYRRGRCHRGASCRFAHTDQLFEKKATAAATDVVEEVSVYQKRFQSICYNWQNSGACARGATCPFQHEGGPVSGQAVIEEVAVVAIDGQEVEDGQEEKKNAKKAKKEKKKRKAEEEEEAADKAEKKATKKAKKKSKSHE